MDRRDFLASAGVGAAALLAGCSAERVAESTTPSGTTTGTTAGTPTLTVGTYQSFVGSSSENTPAAWVKEHFEAEHDAEVQWFVPNGNINYYIQRRNQNVGIDTDLFLGLTPENLVHADAGVADSLFQSVDTSGFENIDHLEDTYRFDPEGRALPFGTSYISLVYNGRALDDRGVPAPETFEDLTKPAYENDVVIPNPQNSETGLEFLFWTIIQYGEDGYLDYWKRLQENNVRILESWSAAYNAYSNGEAPIVVSYSTEQVFASRFGEPLEEHQVGFLNDQGYEYIEGMAPFSETDTLDLAADFMDFMLRADVQAEVCQLNVADPVVDNAPLPASFDELTKEPADPVGYGYGDIQGNLEGWMDEWSKQMVA